MITFLSDYGLGDDFVGVCHGVLASLCPEAHVIDLTHGVPRHDVRAGAVLLRQALPYLPIGVHLAVVDPGVGGFRRAIALRVPDGRVLVGPDNGLLWPAALDRGGIAGAADISNSRFRLEPVSASFHGRDIFAPVAARLADGAELEEVGEPFDPDGLVKLELPAARREGEALVAHVLLIDGFGNLQLDASRGELAAMGATPGDLLALESDGSAPCECRLVRTFADVAVGELLIYEDSYDRVALAVREGSAAERLGLVSDAEVGLSRDAELRIELRR